MFSSAPSPSLYMQQGTSLFSYFEFLFVTFSFLAIVMIITLMFYLCIREEMAKKHDLDPPEDMMIEIITEKLVIYSSRQLKIMTNNFKHKLGEGGFGVVYKGTLEDGVPVAIKVLKGDFSSKIIRCQFEAEVSLIRRTNHPNLVKLYGFCFDKRHKALVYEFMENGSLDEFLFDREKKKMVGWDKLYSIAIGTAEGIAYLHEDCRYRIIHYDIKPENVLLDAKLSPKVSDFGLARFYRRDATHVDVSGFKGTLGYAAPEMFLPFPVSMKCDVYSFGMLLFEILGRRRNLDCKLSRSQEWLPRYVWKKFEEGAMEEMVFCLGISGNDTDMAKRMAMVALWCVQHKPELRPSMSAVVKMLEGEEILTWPPNPFSHVWPDDSEDLRSDDDHLGILARAKCHVRNWGGAIVKSLKQVLSNRFPYLLRESTIEEESF